ncbi:hypothetical protein DC31_08855 [Microbacterium sp. CH12i]|uniref:hypothetical protein n=1 Tax=Microbacterium sp. CH12i TaxID=1479651 RepID=UPI000460DA7B|nr:hypothetical protein [Microbacterium sp. CH12i]KDA06508.1 hypothetical protein DC31_08855 [Microbacterium sp. CH12i]
MLVLFGTETPIPTPSMTVDPNSVTPGPAGFIVVVIVVIALVLLIWDMNRRVRRVRYRGEVREELDAEEAARATAEEPDAAASADPNVDDAAADDETPPAGPVR